jgi:hypothetical protein
MYSGARAVAFKHLTIEYVGLTIFTRCRDQDAGIRMQGSGCRDQDAGIRMQGSDSSLSNMIPEMQGGPEARPPRKRKAV